MRACERVARECGAPFVLLRDVAYGQIPRLERAEIAFDRHHAGARALRETAEIAEAEQLLEGDGRILVRASGTEPLIRVMVEASTETIRAIVGFKFHRGCLALGERGRPMAVRGGS